MEVIYLSVKECRYCNSPIPLVEYNGEVVYKLADSFQARHTSSPNCNGLANYDFSDLDKLELPLITGLAPQPSFADRILPR
jgi:hypothetical protein